jgi:flagellar basal-body rod modification protein FlgD
MSTAIESGTDLYAALGQGSAASKSKADDPGSAERFLTMLVTQLQNQDPLNPMDNAQITSQIAQINTVTELEKVNGSIQALSSQFLQSQMLQGAALIGREVSLDGDLLSFSEGKGQGAIELQGAADTVTVEVLNLNGDVVDTLDLGRAEGGRLAFEWDPGSLPTDVPYGFRVAATQGGKAVAGRTFSVDRVQSVNLSGNTLHLNLAHLGEVPFSQIVTFH